MPLNQIMDKENVANLHIVVLLNSKKQWQLEICVQVDGTGEKNSLNEVTQTWKDEHGMYSLISG